MTDSDYSAGGQEIGSLEEGQDIHNLPISKPDHRRIGLPSLGLRISERKLLLVSFDILFISLSLIISLLLRTDLIRGVPDIWLNLKWFVTLALLWGVIATLLGLYDLARAADPVLGAITSAGAAGLTSLIYLTIPWLTPPIQNRSQGFIFVVISIVSVGLWRLLYAYLFVQPAFQQRAVVVGAGQSGQALAQAVVGSHRPGRNGRSHGTGHEIVAFVDDDPSKSGSTLLGIPVLGTSGRLLELVRELEIDEVIVAITDTEAIDAELFEAVLDCREAGIPVVTMTAAYERLTGRVAFDHASRNVAVATGQEESSYLRFYGLAKRLVDIVLSIIGIAVLLLLSPIVFVLNLFSSPGPIFFRQTRVGRGGREINIIKFRSMIPEAENASGAVWAAIDDDRITFTGRLLRRSHLDELPQVVNILSGDMSFVGPRPERPEFVEELSHSIPFYRARHSVRPGITGWAQIHQDYGDSVEGAHEKLEYDLYYIKNAGPVLDTLIMLRTLTKVLTLRGR
ncbi:MAG: sugar transferase [Candidatus Promineifilaceae bacterium]